MRLPAVTNKLLGLAASGTISAWMGTLEYRVAYYDSRVDPVERDFQGPKIYVFWHEYILIPLYTRGHCRISMLVSQHRDADLLERVALHMGFGCVRGSTTRGGAAALRELCRAGRDFNLAITPDGPRGPRRTLAPGAVYLASRLGMPLVAMGFGYDRCWRLGSWDRFAIPKPHCRARAVLGPELCLPPDLDRDGLEHYRLHVERLLNRLTEDAEAWAVSGGRREGELPAVKRPAPLRYESELQESVTGVVKTFPASRRVA